ncbi:MAG: hypothetical protein RL222_1633 [Bacteroidota bacterium]|nr:hypothetical protein [Chitinophagales bacterium]
MHLSFIHEDAQLFVFFKKNAIRYTRYITTFFIAMLCAQLLFAAGEFRPGGARQAGMGFNAVGTLHIYSVYNNQAIGAFLKRPAIGIYYAPVFVGQGVSNVSGIVAVPVKKGGTIGISANYFGFSGFNEKKVGLSYSLKLAKFLSLGVQLDYLNTKISGYGSKNFVTFELGAFAQPIEELSIGFHVYNPLKLYIDRSTGERIPTLFRLGITYEAVKKFFISAQIDKDLTQKLIFRTGLEYTLKNLINFRAGIATDPVTGTFGLGVIIKEGVSFDAAFSYQSVLGFQPHFGFSYSIGKKKIKPAITPVAPAPPLPVASPESAPPVGQ